MVAQGDSARPQLDHDIQPPLYKGFDEPKAQLCEGLYTLRKKKTRTALDVWSRKDNEECHGYWLYPTAAIGHRIWLIQRSGSDDTYTVKNLQYSKYLDVRPGSGESRPKVIPRVRILEGETRLNQEWRITELEPGGYTLKCLRTSTALEIFGGDPSDGSEVTCSEPAIEKDHQVWILDRVSRTGSEIKAIFESWKSDISARIMQPHGTQTQYFVLPHELRQSLWKETNLPRQPVRPGVFDYNDFVIKCKDAMSTWARDRYPIEVQDVSVLFGIIYGEARKGPKAYNWYLTRDMCSLAFFDAQTGEEYSSTALDGFGFEPTVINF